PAFGITCCWCEASIMHAANSAVEPRPMRSPADAERLTRAYPALRGLRLAPIWAFFAVSFFIDAFTSLPRNSVHRVWPLIPAIALTAIAHRYLNRTFGIVRTMSVAKGVAIVVVALFAFYALQII